MCLGNIKYTRSYLHLERTKTAWRPSHVDRLERRSWLERLRASHFERMVQILNELGAARYRVPELTSLGPTPLEHLAQDHPWVNRLMSGRCSSHNLNIIVSRKTIPCRSLGWRSNNQIQLSRCLHRMTATPCQHCWCGDEYSSGEPQP